jgi:hypothetical protein
MKYVVLRVRKPGEDSAMEFPIAFPEHLVHSFAAAQLTAMLRMQYPKHTEVTCTAAGMFSSMVFAGMEPNGKSDSLGGIANRGDQDMRLFMMNNYGAMHVDVEP